jgi:hypothetical protein
LNNPVTVETFVVRDENRVLHFNGTKLSSATTWEPSKQRWTEMVLYRTARGSYIIEVIGRSTVKAGDDVDGVPARRTEHDIYTARVCDDAAAVVESLNRTDDRGVQFLSIIARDLLDAASELDDAIDQEYTTQYID